MKDFLSIMKEHNYFVGTRWDKTNSVYTFETGSQIEFFSVDQTAKVRGPRRDRLFINEAEGVPFSSFEELEVRTKEVIYLDWNPVSEFWFYSNVKQRDDVDHITLTYKDNESLDPRIVDTIERRKYNKGWWQVYGLGQLGEVEGKIYKDWEIIEHIPHQARVLKYGIDFGYTNDPTAIVGIYYYNGGYILEEIAYQRGLSNKNIADILLDHVVAPCIADSAEPKSIDEIKGYGITILPAVKGPDSIRNGIATVQDQRISVTSRSLNIIKEYKNYLWKIDNDGKILNIPEDSWNHCMDAIRYAMTSIVKKPILQMKASNLANPYYLDIGL